MICLECGASVEKGTTANVTEIGDSLVIVRKVPCFKCSKCNEVTYSADIIQQLERIIESSKCVGLELSVIDYDKWIRGMGKGHK